MPAFGKDGIHNINSTTTLTTYELVDEKGNVIESSNSKEVLLSKINSNKNLTIREKQLKCL